MMKVFTRLSPEVFSAAVLQEGEKLFLLGCCFPAEIKTTTSLRSAQPDTYMITLAGAGSLLGWRGRVGGEGRGVDSKGSNSS